MRQAVVAVVLFGLGASPAWAGDWPMYGGSAARDGFTEATLPERLSARWVVHPRHAPMPAWPASNRLPFDRAFHPVVAHGLVFFNSSADGKVRALDAATGQERWSFQTGAPVRFAPAVWKDRVLAASDDGFLYCLSARDGQLCWSKRGGPDDRMLLGNDRMISRWPVRGGPVVVGDIVYFAAGIWPSDGIYLHALDAASGKAVWLNDRSGSIWMGQPHGGAYADSGVAAQGYLVATEEQLLVPTGRAVPAAFERTTGKFQFFRLQLNGHRGGTSTLATRTHFINAGWTYDSQTGIAGESLGDGAVAAFPDGILHSTAKELIASAWADKSKPDRKGVPVRYRGLEKRWSLPGVPGGQSLVVAGKLAVCGGPRQVSVIDLAARKVTWSAAVDGIPYALAVAGDRLYVGTDQGTLYCFDGSGTTSPTVHRRADNADVYGKETPYATTAAQIVKETGVTEGYCVDLGCGDGALAFELARRTRLQVLAVDPDPEKVAAARRKLDAAGLLGVRVTVHQADLARVPYPRYFANLVVSARSLTEGPEAVPAAAVTHLLRPAGGIAFLGKPGSWQKQQRERLAGAGNWTHQYADPANTCCSSDHLVKGPLGMLWFRDSDFAMPSRHGRAPAPLFLDGRLFVEGMNAIRAVDAYNGRTLWEYLLPGILKAYHGEHLVGTAATHSNVCVNADSLYARLGDRCLRIDPVTGKKLAEFTAPRLPDGKPAPWGYLACDQDLLFGSLARPDHVVKFAYGKADMSQLLTESSTLFALDVRTGQPRWTWTAKHSIRHNAIAIGGGRVFLIDRPLAEVDRPGAPKTGEHPTGELLALDAASGKVLWRSRDNVYGTLLALSVPHDVLVMSYQPTRFKLPSETGGHLAAFQASDGRRLWERKASYLTRPVLNDRTVYVQGGAWDVKTGADRTFTFKRSYGCGQLAGSTHLMVFRSATLGYYDLIHQKGTIDYGGIRPGCWINAIPAGGVVLVPDATSGCQCSYLNQAWIALQGME